MDQGRPKLTTPQILEWADAHRARTGAWPTGRSGPVAGAPGETWDNVRQVLQKGLRGLPGGSSLARLLARARGVRNHRTLPPLAEGRIAAWAREHHRRTGAWPRATSGPVAGSPGETWSAVSYALRQASRGLPGGDTLARLLARRCGVAYWYGRPLTIEAILAWADRHRSRTGAWPAATSGAVAGVPGETWRRIGVALREGWRGLPGGSSLPLLLAEHRGRRDKSRLPPLTVGKILAWAEAHRRRTGDWPAIHSGPIPEEPGESWRAVNMTLYRGGRGLPGGDSLKKLLVRHGRGRAPAGR